MAEDQSPIAMSRWPRRRILGALGAGLMGRPAVAAAPPAPRRLGAPAPFDSGRLTLMARALASQPYAPPPPPDPGLERLDFDAYGGVRYAPEHTLLGGASAPRIRLFPQGRLFPRPVRIHLVSGGVAREVLYAPDLFECAPDHPFRRLARAGFAGFRVLNPVGEGDWLAYLGAAYFRAAGPLDQYGPSARGLAINAGGPAVEEFPAFTSFWLEALGPLALRVYALMDSASVSGAFVFDCAKTAMGVIQTVRVELNFRRPVETLGLAPLTSMFWYGEDSPPRDRDWRPQIHDSDGLALATGAGEAIFRPLLNPPRVLTNAFLDESPKAYALVQRNRRFESYQDDGAFYERRPDIWIEPQIGFSKGAVRLVELPTHGETEDNIVAFWTPDAPTTAGARLAYAYAIRWTGGDPRPEAASGGRPLARALALRTGVAGPPGLPARPGWRRVAIDFDGTSLAGLDRLRGAVPIVSSPSGARIDNLAAYGVVGRSVWRLIFDAEVQQGRATDLRAQLSADGRIVSETVVYQLFAHA